jgi:hypothetical protein
VNIAKTILDAIVITLRMLPPLERPKLVTLLLSHYGKSCPKSSQSFVKLISGLIESSTDDDIARFWSNMVEDSDVLSIDRIVRYLKLHVFWFQNTSGKTTLTSRSFLNALKDQLDLVDSNSSKKKGEGGDKSLFTVKIDCKEKQRNVEDGEESEEESEEEDDTGLSPGARYVLLFYARLFKSISTNSGVETVELDVVFTDASDVQTHFTLAASPAQAAEYLAIPSISIYPVESSGFSLVKDIVDFVLFTMEEDEKNKRLSKAREKDEDISDDMDSFISRPCMISDQDFVRWLYPSMILDSV